MDNLHKELDTSYKKVTARKRSIIPLIIIVALVCIIIFLIGTIIKQNTTQPVIIEESEPEILSITITQNSKDLLEDNYEIVTAYFKDLGFTNIKTLPLEDLKLGFLKKENAVDHILIDGQDVFKDGDSFLQDVPVVIYYHSKPEKNE